MFTTVYYADSQSAHRHEYIKQLLCLTILQYFFCAFLIFIFFTIVFVVLCQ